MWLFASVAAPLPRHRPLWVILLSYAALFSVADDVDFPPILTSDDVAYFASTYDI